MPTNDRRAIGCLTAAAVLVLVQGCAHKKPEPTAAAAPSAASAASAAAPAAPVPAYIARGDKVEAKNRVAVEKLAAGHAKLKKLIQDKAPSLLSLLEPAPPAPVKYGYGMLPKILWADAALHDPKRLATAKGDWVKRDFNWPEAEKAIDRLVDRVKGFEASLQAAANNPTEQAIRGQIDLYKSIDAQRGVEERVIQYNRSWQDHIAKNPSIWIPTQTRYDYLIKRGPGAPPEFPEAAPRPFFKASVGPRGVKRVTVPVATDITDAKFLADFKKLIENFWRWDDGKDRYEIKVKYTKVKLAELYPNGGAPKPGEPYEIKKHLEKFPVNHAGLTTGVSQLYFDSADNGTMFIALPAGEVSEFPLAHEFGHILGFNDDYQRGYKDRGADGYSVLELIPDGSDIMADSNHGLPRKWRFEAVYKRAQSNK